MIAVPLVVLGTGDDDEKDPDAKKAVGATFPEGNRPGDPGSYKGKSSSHEASKGDKDEKGKGHDGKGGSDVDPDSGGKKSSEDGEDGKEKGDPSEDGGSSKDEKSTYTGPGARLPDQVQLVNAMTGMCVDIPGKGKGKVNGAVNQDPCADDRRTDNQRWAQPVARDVSPSTGWGARMETMRTATSYSSSATGLP